MFIVFRSASHSSLYHVMTRLTDSPIMPLGLAVLLHENIKYKVV